MVETITIARPYAEAAFRFARDAGALTAWSEALQKLAIVAADASVRQSLGDPLCPRAKIIDFFVNVSGITNQKQKDFVIVLADSARLEFLPDIAALFESLKDEYDNVVVAQVESAFVLTPAEVGQLTAQLEEKYTRSVKVTVTVNPCLIGGISIRIGDLVHDLSVRSKLAALANTLKN